jgi:hypothetical protein
MSKWKMTKFVNENGEIRNRYELVEVAIATKSCSGCDKSAAIKGLCWNHYWLLNTPSVNLDVHYRLVRK